MGCRDQVLSVRLRTGDNDVQQAIRLLAPVVSQVSDGRAEVTRMLTSLFISISFLYTDLTWPRTKSVESLFKFLSND